MGKPSTIQPTLGPSSAEVFDHRIARGVGQDDQVPSRPPASIKPASTSTLNASLTSRPASPSIDTSRHESVPALPASDNDDTLYNALDSNIYPIPTLSTPKPNRASGIQQAPAQASFVTTTATPDDDGDIFYDAVQEIDDATPSTPVSAKHPRTGAVQQVLYDSDYEGASKGRTSGAPTRARGSRATTASAPPAAAYTFPAFTASVPGRGSSGSVAAPDLVPSFAPLLWSAPPPPPPASVVRAPTKKGLLIGMNYETSHRPLKYAIMDAAKFGQLLTDRFQFPEENLIFATDTKRTAPSGPTTTATATATVSARRNHVVAAPSWNFAPAGEPQWQGTVHSEGKKRFVHPTRANLIEGFKFLTMGAVEGDELFMLFSGHCSYYGGKPYLITASADGRLEGISKEELSRELIRKVPKGCSLTIVLDCCHSAAMIDLQYCVGNMRPKTEARAQEAPNVTVVTAPQPTIAATKPAPSSDHDSLQGSLYGVQRNLIAIAREPVQEPELIMIAEEPEPAMLAHELEPVMLAQEPERVMFAQDPVLPGGFNVGVEPFAPAPVPRNIKRQCGVVAAPAPTPVPTPAPNQACASTSWIPAWMKGAAVSEPIPAPTIVEARSSEIRLPEPRSPEPRPPIVTSAAVRQTRNCVVEATRLADHFEERKAGFDRPEGVVTFWAGAGADQSAFEAYGRVKHGIVTNALCKALETCQSITYRDLWGQLQNAIESENEHRSRRDQDKPENERPNPKTRTQHAELWVSQVGPLNCAADVLNKRAFCPVMETSTSNKLAIAAT